MLLMQLPRSLYHTVPADVIKSRMIAILIPNTVAAKTIISLFNLQINIEYFLKTNYNNKWNLVLNFYKQIVY